mmetsp:Transcript_13527/g.27624  ORF Transcript_13527/g.27624 Transcript_13527/m.27624 type:complete len:206 (-) Transcript_13527:1326-1943(-)
MASPKRLVSSFLRHIILSLSLFSFSNSSSTSPSCFSNFFVAFSSFWHASVSSAISPSFLLSLLSTKLTSLSLSFIATSRPVISFLSVASLSLNPESSPAWIFSLSAIMEVLVIRSLSLDFVVLNSSFRWCFSDLRSSHFVTVTLSVLVVSLCSCLRVDREELRFIFWLCSSLTLPFRSPITACCCCIWACCAESLLVASASCCLT